MEEQITNWRREVHDVFHDARRELREILSALDQLVGPSSGSSAVPSAEPPPSSRPESPERRRGDEEQAHSGLEYKTSSEVTDLADRLEQLRRQLDQRLQDRPHAAGQHSLDEVHSPAD